MKPLENIQHYKIVLASNSPRRRELLSGLNLEYTVRVLPDIDESYPDTLKGEDIPMYISREKAEAYRNSMAEDELIITADTVVCINEKVLGKPQTLEEAKEESKLNYVFPVWRIGHYTAGHRNRKRIHRKCYRNKQKVSYANTHNLLFPPFF